MDFEEIAIAIIWGPLFGVISAQGLSMVICIFICARGFIFSRQRKEFFLLSIAPTFKVALCIAMIMFGNYLIVEFGSRSVYSYLFTQFLILFGLAVGGIMGSFTVRRYINFILRPEQILKESLNASTDS